MRKITQLITFGVAATALSALVSGGAMAQAVRTFVSGHGTDSGTCGVGSPCRTFAFAITQTAAGGEIAVLDTAGYGVVTINKAISIVNQDGVEAGITTSSAINGVTVSAGAGDLVRLRGLTVSGGGVGNVGIIFENGAAVVIENCAVSGFGIGISLAPGASSQSFVSDTVVFKNGTEGLFFGPAASGATNQLFMERVTAVLNGADGMAVQGGSATGGTINATASDSIASGNGSMGFGGFSLVGATQPTFTVLNSQSTYNQNGVFAQNATVILAKSTTFGNTANGFDIASGGVIKSLHDNNILDTTNTGTLTYTFTPL